MICPNPTSLSISLVSSKINAAMVEVLRNYTHKSFITFFTVGLIFHICMILELARLITTTNSTTEPQVILLYYICFILAVCVLSLSCLFLFVFWQAIQHAIDKTTRKHNYARVLFFLVDLITAIKWFSAIRGGRDGIQYILMVSYIKAGSLAVLGFMFLMSCVHRQRKNKTFQSLLKLKFGVLIFLLLHVTIIMTFKYYAISWEVVATVCAFSYLGFVSCVMVLFCGRKEDSRGRLVTPITITVLIITLYVIMITLFVAALHGSDCEDSCGQRALPSTHVTIIKTLDAYDTPKVSAQEMDKERTCKINQTRGSMLTRNAGLVIL